MNRMGQTSMFTRPSLVDLWRHYRLAATLSRFRGRRSFDDIGFGRDLSGIPDDVRMSLSIINGRAPFAIKDFSEADYSAFECTPEVLTDDFPLASVRDGRSTKFVEKTLCPHRLPFFEGSQDTSRRAGVVVEHRIDE